MKQSFDTLAVFLANVLQLRPTSWLDAKKQAVQMRQAHLGFRPAKVYINGKEEDVMPAASPITYLGDAILLALGYLGLAWVVYQVLAACLFLLPYLLVLAALGVAMRLSPSRKAEWAS